MAWTCRLDNVEEQDYRFAFSVTVFNNGTKVISDTIYIASDTLLNVASDKRLLYVKKVVEDACRKYQVVKAIANEFSQYIGQSINLPDPTFKTQAEIDAQNQTPPIL